MAVSILVQIALCLLLTNLAASEVTHSKQPKKPHIIYLLVDDWGWANVGYHRNPPTPEVVSPNFDSLMKQGLELDQYYVYQFCSPSRSSFLTGRLPIHVNDENGKFNYYNPKDPVSGFKGIPRNMTGIAEKLREAGYATHQVGKWHAGAATPDHIPTGRGFNTSYGYLNGANDYYTEQDGFKCNGTPIVDLWDTDKPAAGQNGTDYEEALFKKRLLQVLNEHNPSTPLFLYYAPHIVHAPLQVPDNYANKFNFIDNQKRQIYHAMVTYLDDVVGNMTEILKRRGFWDNLLLVVSSDNGGPLGSANNYPLKGGKFSDWQGGIRVNAFVTGGYLPENMRGQKTEGYIHIADWYATFCALAGVDPTDKRAEKAKLPPIDSMNMWPFVSGQNSTSPRTDIPASKNTLISGDYKILIGNVPEAGWTGPQNPNNTHHKVSAVEHCGDNGYLYNIKKDPSEHVNLATEMPDMLQEMRTRLAKYQATYFNPDRGKEWPEACTTFVQKYDDFWGPFLP